MRQSLFLLLLLCIGTSTSTAQRPWVKTSNPQVGEAPQLSTAAKLLHIFDSELATSLNQGLAWDKVSTIPSNIRAVGDFFNNVTLCLSQVEDKAIVQVYFTTNGTSWSFSETLDLNQKTVVSVGAIGQAFYVSTREGMMYERGVEIDSMMIDTDANTEIVDVVINDDVMAATTTSGIYISMDQGETWMKSNPPGTTDGVITNNLVLHRDGVLCPTPSGVYLYDLDDQEWGSVGVWEGFPQPPTISTVAARERWILAMAQTPNGRHQMYRLESGDTVWTETAYEVPVPSPTVSKNMLVIDAGWAILYQASSTDADSTGVYIYNLNDFTSVAEFDAKDDVQVRLTDGGITVVHPWDNATVTIADLSGSIAVQDVSIAADRDVVRLAPYVKGVLAVTVRSPLGAVARKVVLR